MTQTPWLIRLTLAAVALALSACATPTTQAPVPQSGAQSRDLQVQVNGTLRYWVQLPADYSKDPARRWPTLFFLHGSGERGDDLQRVKVHGPPKIAEADPQRLPFIVISPQVSEHDNWDPHLLHGLLERLKTEWRIDPDRVSVTGLSMGGRGTWDWALTYPRDLAAIAPVSGEGDSLRACRIRDLPVWAFHGEADTVVPFAAHLGTIGALLSCGAQPRWTPYPGVGHDAWTATYNNPALYEWLLAQRRPTH